MHEISNVPRSVRKPYLRASYHVYKIGCLLVRGISLPVAQLFVIAIEKPSGGRGGGFNYIAVFSRSTNFVNLKKTKNIVLLVIKFYINFRMRALFPTPGT